MAAAEDAQRRPRRITKGVAEIVERVRTFFEEERHQGQRINVSQVVQRTAEATGLSTRTINRIKAKGSEAFPADGEAEVRDREPDVPRYFHGIIRAAICSLYLSHRQVTLDTILQHIQSGMHTRESPEFDWGRTTLWRTLHRIGFSCSAGSSHYDRVKEKASVVLQRLQYTRKIQELRAEGCTIFYQDETWFNKNMVPLTERVDERGRGGRDAPAGKGSRFIVNSVGSRACGLLPSALFCVAVNYSKESEDYHNSMNAEIYLGWLKDIVLPLLQTQYPNSILVLDQASYHRTFTEDTRSVWKKMRKDEIIAFLISRGVAQDQVPPHVPQTVPELWDLAGTVVGPPKHEVVAWRQNLASPLSFS